ncbi:MAG: hypothetical protein JWN48_867, partial [Myxococcaceae bacterium]|nr:hypothetical protein [Myxococcaceae bacterium]
AALDVLLATLTPQPGASGAELPAADGTLRRTLKNADPVALAHAVDALGAARAPDSISLEQAIRLSLDRGLPRLALRLREQHAARLPPQLEARLLAENGLRAQLAALVAESDSDALGGHERTAQLALEAHAFERAELEATSALQQQPSDAMHALRARAALALGQPRQALPDVRAVSDAALRRSLLAEALAASGAPALAHELAIVRAPEGVAPKPR